MWPFAHSIADDRSSSKLFSMAMTTERIKFWGKTVVKLIVFVFCRVQNVTDKIFAIIREMAPAKGIKSVKMSDIMEQCTTKGFKPDQVDACVEEYEELNVWQVNQAHTKVTFI